MIKVIAFDYGGVIKINENDLFGDICDYLKISKDEWSQEYSKINDIYDTGDKGFEDVMYSLASKFNNSEETRYFIKKLLEESKGKSHLNTELIEMIKDLKGKGYKTPLLSNNSSTLRKKLAEHNILGLFDEIVISGEVGFSKPNPKIFDILFKKLNSKPEEVVFIDNSIDMFEGSEKIGYIPVLYKNNESLKLELSNILSVKL
jgi:epoxide hydrolase-like predicted phosphatase